MPNFGAAMLEELKELWDHDIKRPVESIAVQELSRIFTDLL